METQAARTPSTSSAHIDRNLLRRLQQGDKGAHAELCTRFGAALHGFAASRLGGDDELAEEIMVQTLMDAVRNIGHFDPVRSTLAAWLYGIARRQIQGEQRKQRRRKSVPPSAQVSIHLLPEVAAGEDMVAGLAGRLDAQRKVAEMAKSLSEAEMEVLILHYVDEFSVKEIARIVGRSERAVDSLLYRAKQKAREGLVKDGG